MSLEVKDCRVLMEFRSWGRHRDQLHVLGTVELKSKVAWRYDVAMEPEVGWALTLDLLTDEHGVVHPWPVPFKRWTRERLVKHSVSFAPLEVLESHQTWRFNTDPFTALLRSHELAECLESLVYQLLAVGDTLLVATDETQAFRDDWTALKSEAELVKKWVQSA